jgi:hypothetical protein
VKEAKPLYLYAFKSDTAPPVPEGVDYRASSPDPDAAQALVRRPALRAEGDARLAEEVAAIEGSLYHVILAPTSENPGGTTLPDYASFTRGYLSVEAILSEVPARSVDPSAVKRETIRLPVIINR